MRSAAPGSCLHGLVKYIANREVIPRMDDDTEWLEGNFYTPFQSGTRDFMIRSWSSEAKPSDQKALLLLTGNCWGGGVNVRTAMWLQNALKPGRVRVYTMNYLGQNGDKSGSRSIQNHEDSVHAMLDLIRSHGFGNESITILGHSIGGYLAGLALAHEKHDGINLLAVASPDNIGGIVASHTGHKEDRASAFSAALGHPGTASSGFKKEQEGIRIAVKALKDRVVPSHTSITGKIPPEQRRAVRGGHSFMMSAKVFVQDRDAWVEQKEETLMDLLQNIMGLEPGKSLQEQKAS